MSIKIVLIALLAVAAVQAAKDRYGLNALSEMPKNFDEVFATWRELYNKEYATVEEEAYRLSVFIDNVVEAVSHNSNGNAKFTKGLNQFADMTVEEFTAKYLQSVPASSSERRLRRAVKSISSAFADGDVPYYVNWDQRGIVTRPRQQGDACTAGYAFATVAHLETIKALQNGVRAFLSEQQLIDCSASQGNTGCKGGNAQNSLNYAIQFDIESMFDYPYTGKDGNCTFSANGGGIIDKANQVPQGDCNALLQAVVNGTVVAGVDATDWKSYTGGVLESGGDLKNHYVLLVGYLQNADLEGYWIVKNSWGATWGEEGFARLQIGDNSAICDDAWYGTSGK